MPQPSHPLMRPDDADAYRHVLRLIRRRTELPIVFGGPFDDGSLVLSEFIGTQTDGMRGLHVLPGKGMGGYVLEQRRPYTVNDYGTATTITHDYDDPALGEGICAIAAAPVTVRGTVRGVLYTAIRSTFSLGDRVTDALVDGSRRLAGELTIRDEVDKRVRLLASAESTAGPANAGAPSKDELRELHTELRSIAQGLDAGALRERLYRACDRFAWLGAPNSTPHEAGATTPRLASRELDVLANVALGCSNKETAQRLSLRPETVKAYLQNAASKLGVRGRQQTVIAARRAGLLP
jgi:DNA-binding CsgD family transcriptional regulator